MNRTKQSKSSTNQFNYRFNHFYKDFMKGYSLATSEVDERLIETRLKAFTGELLKRPGVAFSEFAETLCRNVPRIDKHLPILSSSITNLSNILKYITLEEEPLNKFRSGGIAKANF